MKVQITYRNIWTLAHPLIFAGMSETIIDVTDAFFLAKYGITELGAVAIADAIYGMLLFLTLGLVDGIQILVARRAGEGRDKEVGKVFNQGFYLIALASVAVFVTVKFATPYLVSGVIDSDPVRAAVEAFLQVMAFGVLFHSVNLAYSALLVGISRTKVLISATAILAITNVALDYSLIFGNWGLPRMGIRGAAIASVAAEISAFIFLTGYILWRVDIGRFGLFAVTKWNWRLSKVLVNLSSPVVLDILVETIRWFLFFLIIEKIGEQALAMSNIIYSFYAVFLIPIGGISEALCSMVSNVIGQGKERLVRLLTRKAVLLGHLTALPFAAIAVLAPEQVLGVFTTDSEIIDGCVDSLRIICLGLFIVIPDEMFSSALSGAGDTRVLFLIELVSTSFVLLCAYALAVSLGLPLEFVWVAEITGGLIGFALSYSWVRIGYWKKLYLRLH